MMKKDTFSVDIVITGIGGQGVLLLTQILGNVALKVGLNAASSELHGMAQRGGVVISYVRIGRNVYASTVADGQADIILALEPAEALRALRYAHASTLILIGKTPVVPPLSSYPQLDSIISECRKATQKVVVVDSVGLAVEAGNRRIQNIVLLGYLAATELIPADIVTIKEIIRESVPKKFVDMNLKAFELGYRLYRTS